MPFPFMSSSINSGMSTDADTYWRNLQQGMQDTAWDNTTQRQAVYEETYNGTGVFDPVDAWATPIVGISGTNYYKYPDNSMKFLFRSVNHDTQVGRYYEYGTREDGSPQKWIAYFVGHEHNVQKYIAAAYCDNVLRMVDSADRTRVIEYPCHINNEATAGSPTITSYVITPNNKLNVVVQSNLETRANFKLNTRFIISDRCFKIVAMQNAHNEWFSNKSGILYLSLALDEIHDKDDFVNGIAYNGEELEEDEHEEITVTPLINKVKMLQPVVIEVTPVNAVVTVVDENEDTSAYCTVTQLETAGQWRITPVHISLGDKVYLQVVSGSVTERHEIKIVSELG